MGKTLSYQLVYRFSTEFCRNQAWCNLSFANLLQLVETACNKPVDNKFGQSTCNKSVDKLQQACRQQAVTSHANASWYRLVATSCCKMSTDLLQLARFWLCTCNIEIIDLECVLGNLAGTDNWKWFALINPPWWIGTRSADQSINWSINWLAELWAEHKAPNTKLLYCNKLQTFLVLDK